MQENAKSWTTNQEKVQEWLATPRYTRIPPTQELLAVELGLNAVTISRWKKIDGFMDAVTAKARAFLKDDLPEIYGALRREAIAGNYQHIKIALELTGEYMETSHIKHDLNISADDLATAENELRGWISNESKSNG